MIFTGNWFDPEGVPFIPGAKLIHTYSPGGAASDNQGGRRYARNYQAFVNATRNLSNCWHYELTQGDRDAWYALARAPHDRWDQEWDPDGNGWLLFQARNFQQMYYAQSLDANPPTYVPGAGIAEFLVTADLATQQLEYSFDYDATFATQTQACVSIYQVNPTNCAGPVHRKQTRLIAKETEWDPGGGICEGEAAAAFPFADYPDVYTLWRVGDGGLYHLNQAVGTVPA